MKGPSENPPLFVDCIELNAHMTKDEAVLALAEFHGAPPENVLAAFMNLRNFQDEGGTVEFRNGVNNGNPCIVMEGKHSDGSYAWRHLIDKYTGQPQVFCS